MFSGVGQFLMFDAGVFKRIQAPSNWLQQVTCADCVMRGNRFDRASKQAI